MTNLTSEQEELLTKARELADKELRPRAADVDRKRLYPSENLASLGSAGLMGLMVPREYGGQSGSLTDLALVAAELGAACASTAMCYLMHCCGSALIASRATPAQGERWLRPAARGEAIATLAFSERGTGARFYMPELRAEQRNGATLISGRKSFVTSGGQATLYPVLVNAPSDQGLDIYVITPEKAGLSFEGEWAGIGMAGNSSITMNLQDVQATDDDLLGAHGDGQALVFNVVAPTFLIGLAGVNCGIAAAALDASVAHAKARSYATGENLAAVTVIQNYIADMSLQVEAARSHLLRAARAADSGDPTALLLVMQAKVKATETARSVTEKAMQLGGGQAYSGILPIERHWRDAHAGSVMAPTNEVLCEWMGKSILGLPLF